jgi:diguanylate cyclase (GGDEF)-like protein
LTRASRVHRDAAGRRFAARRAVALASVLLVVAALVLVVGPALFPLFVLPVLLGAAFFVEVGAVGASLCAGGVIALAVAGRGGAWTGPAAAEALVACAAFVVAGLAVARLQRRHRARHDELAASSLTDRLTGLYTYGTFADYLRTEVRKAERYGGELCLIMIDLDHFKRFNDRFGHQLGNELLRRVGATLRGHVREADMAARFGGEEFALLIRGGERQGQELAERVRRALEATGVSLPGGAIVFAAASADRALYESKRRGRNRVTLASETAIAPAVGRAGLRTTRTA